MEPKVHVNKGPIRQKSHPMKKLTPSKRATAGGGGGGEGDLHMKGAGMLVHIGVLLGFNSKFPTGIPTPFAPLSPQV